MIGRCDASDEAEMTERESDAGAQKASEKCRRENRHRKDVNILEENKKIKGIIEAILFTMGRSVSLDQLVNVLEMDREALREILLEMKEEYHRDEERGICLIELDDSWQICTKMETYDYVRKLVSQPKKRSLTDVMLETLSIIAYKQPVTKLEIEKIRGVKCDHAVNKLIEYNLVTELGRLDAPGRPIVLGTTEEFLRCFGVENLDELPVMNPVKLEDFKAEAEEEVQLKLDL